jgi:hypothetical protein
MAGRGYGAQNPNATDKKFHALFSCPQIQLTALPRAAPLS